MSDIFEIPEGLKDKAYLKPQDYNDLYVRSIQDPEKFWEEMAHTQLDWFAPWHTVLECDFAKAQIKWFLGGKLNVSYNCIDRHLKTRANKVALIWEGNEPGDTRHLTYQQLYRAVCKFANVLTRHGIKKGERVAIYMPMVPELAVAMLACARIGAIHSVIFGGFSAEAIRERVLDCGCSAVITADQGLRGSKTIQLKNIIDEALEGLECVRTVLVHRRTGAAVPMLPGRDFRLEEELENAAEQCEPESMDSEDPLFILYTSGSTGKPKGVLHTQAGYLLHASLTHKYIFDYHEEDIYFCAADVGWVTGHSYIVYGPLANGATSVMFESIPTYPDAGRYWDVIERHKVNIFYTAPTAIRAVAKEGPDLPDKYDLNSLRILGSVGEPINEDAWLWYYNKVGREKCAIVDTWWQTETGGIMISPLPGATRTKPGSAGKPFFGVQACLVDENGLEISEPNVTGRLCIKFPWPGQMRTVYGDHQRFFNTYFKQFPGKYFTGDAAHMDKDGYYWISGRVDDVLNVSGHRLGTAELESAIVHSGIVAEAAVVGVTHDIKGTAVCAFCILRDGVDADVDAQQKVKDAVRKAIGAFAAPDFVCFVPGLPKTRSGKIMRRILRIIAEGEYDDLGDTTTLADPTVLESIKKVKSFCES